MRLIPWTIHTQTHHAPHKADRPHTALQGWADTHTDTRTGETGLAHTLTGPDRPVIHRPTADQTHMLLGHAELLQSSALPSLCTRHPHHRSLHFLSPNITLDFPPSLPICHFLGGLAQLPQSLVGCRPVFSVHPL